MIKGRERLSEYPDGVRTPFFDLYLQGSVPPEDVITRIVHQPPQTSRGSERFINEYWQTWSGRKFPNDEKPSRLHFVSAEIIEGQLYINGDPCISYKEFTGATPVEFRQRFGWENVPMALSTSMFLSTGDNELIFTLRNDSTDYKPGGLSTTSGGFVDINKDLDESGNPSIVKAMFRETEEETGLTPQDLKDVSWVNIGFNPHSPSVGVNFCAKTQLTAQEVINRPHDDENKLLSISDDPDELRRLLAYYPHAIVTMCILTIIGYGDQKYGSDFREAVLADLMLEGRGYPTYYQSLEARDKVRLYKDIGRTLGSSAAVSLSLRPGVYPYQSD